MSKINLYKFVSKDDLRPLMCGVYHDADEKCAVASNSIILIMSRNDFDPSKAGKVIGKKGDEISQERQNYPRWRGLVHTPEVLERDANPFPVEQFFKAVDNASNFLKNVPQTYEDGTKIKKDQRSVHLHFAATDKDGEEVTIGLKYDFARLIADLPREGARMYFYSNRRAIEYVNEQTGIQCLLMPLIVNDNFKISEAGILNCKGEEELWTGCTICTAFGDGKGLYRTPEKREPVKQAKCIQNGKGYLTAVTKHYPLADLKPIEEAREKAERIRARLDRGHNEIFYQNLKEEK